MASPCPTTTSSKAMSTRIRTKPHPGRCKVCHRPSFYTYYLVQCCEGCKQFFRRVLINRKEYVCRRDRNGICLTEKGKRCLGCRLDQCLVAGMRPRILHQQQFDDAEWYHFVRRLDDRRKQIIMKRTPNMAAKRNIAEQENAIALVKGPVLANVEEWHLLDSLLLRECRQWQIWKATTELPSWLDKFQSVDEMIQFPGYLLPALANAEQNREQTKRLLTFPELQYKQSENFEEMCPAEPEIVNFICIDILLMLEWARALPVFKKLEADDQLVLLRHSYLSFCAICNAFYATLLNADTWTRGNGYIFHGPRNFGKLWNDERMRFLSAQAFCRGVDAIRASQISREEFVLLLAIIFTNSNASGLTALGREKLYDQSTEYCRILIRFLQQRHGNEAGAKKFADCMQLLGLMLRMKGRIEMLQTYWCMSVFIDQQHEQVMTEFPKVLSPFNPF